MPSRAEAGDAAASRSSAASRPATARDRLLVSFEGFELSPAAAEAIARRASGVTLYRHLNVDTPAQVRALVFQAWIQMSSVTM